MRPSWNEYFMGFAVLAGTRSTCCRRNVGAVLVKDNRILATGYNGAPRGAEHCTHETCIRSVHDVPSGTRHELCKGVHAEQNLVCQAAFHGVSANGAAVYCTHSPCSICYKLLVNAGVVKIYFRDKYLDPLTEQLRKECSVELVLLPSSL